MLQARDKWALITRGACPTAYGIRIGLCAAWGCFRAAASFSALMRGSSEGFGDEGFHAPQGLKGEADFGAIISSARPQLTDAPAARLTVS